VRKRGPASPLGLPQIEGYTIEEQIGSGGFSKVYRAVQHGLDRPVAIKVLNTSFEDDRQQRTFDRECKVMGRLSSHPNIVTVHDSALTKQQHPCIIMELYHGTYRDQGILDVAEVVEVGTKLADALQAIHDEGIVHRDIKPHNIFISDRGQPAIGDFGISSVDNERTITGSAGFSINYAAPEVFEEGGANQPGDLYALGASLYHLATGEVPFPHAGPATDRLRSTIHKIIAEPAPSLRIDQAPDGLDTLLRQLMAKAATDRPPSAAAVAQELRELRLEVPVTPNKAVSAPRPKSPEIPVAPLDESSLTDNVTYVRKRDDETRLRADSGAGPDDREKTAGIRKNVLIGAALAVLLIVVSVTVIVATGGSETAQPTPTSTTTSLPANEIVFPVTPTVVSVDRTDAGVYIISWDSTQDDVEFRIQLVGSGESVNASESPLEWTTAAESVTACFEVSTFTEFRISAASSPPSCFQPE